MMTKLLGLSLKRMAAEDDQKRSLPRMASPRSESELIYKGK